MNVWICIAYDPIPGVDHTTRLLRYGTLADRLARQGHSVVMWTSTFDHWRKTQRFQQDTSIDVSERLRVELLHAPAYGRNVALARFRHNRQLARRFSARAAERQPPDVIFAGIPCLELTEAAADYAVAHGVPFVADVQDVWPEVYVSVLPRLLRPLGRLALTTEFSRVRRIFGAARSVTAVSRQYLDWAQRISPPEGRQDEVIHLGYALPSSAIIARARQGAESFLARLGLDRECTLVTFLGQFAASYDVESIVGAARLLKSSHPGLHFVLAGSGDKLANVRAASEGMRSVTLTGWLEYQETITLMQQSHVGLAAYSRRAPQSLPYKPFEYMAFGLPIISSLDGELRTIIEENGIGGYYRAGDPRSLADAIALLVADPATRRLAGEAAHSLYVRRFDAEQLTDRLISHLESLRTRTD